MHRTRYLLLTTLLLSTFPSDARIWTNTNGKSIEATFIKLEDDIVHLKKNNRVYKVSINTLSRKDREFIANRKKEEDKEEAKPEPQVQLPINLNIRISGDALKDEDLQEKPIVLHQWQAHCGACSPALRAFEKLAKRKKKSGAVFMIWHSADKPSLAKSKSGQLGLKLPVYHGPMIKWDKKFGKFLWPHVVLIDARGKIIHMGTADKKFQKLLKDQTR